MKVLGIIPARYGSTRFPGKPLAQVNGKSLISRVYHQAKKADLINKVLVATDDNRILEHVESFGGEAILTSEKHTSGTERCAEVAQKFQQQFNVIINIQGDEPYILPTQIDQVAELFNDTSTEIATLVKKISMNDDLFNENIVKVVCGLNGNALYFSRSPIPFLRGAPKPDWVSQNTYFKHIGIYAYRPGILEEIAGLKPANLEEAERLEQLRWLAHGYIIKTAVTQYESLAVDAPEDLLKFTNKV